MRDIRECSRLSWYEPSKGCERDKGGEAGWAGSTPVSVAGVVDEGVRGDKKDLGRERDEAGCEKRRRAAVEDSAWGIERR